MSKSIDLNCDMGEGFDTDALIMPLISSVNIACGYHAGDEQTIRKTIGLALEYGVAIGAHPSYPDRNGFGRNAMQLSANELHQIIVEQVNLIKAIAIEMGAWLHHVKPHGALYNTAAKDTDTAITIAQAIHEIDPALSLYGLPHSESARAASAVGLKYANEVFADRTYTDEGQLTPRNEPNAMISDEEEAMAQVLMMVCDGRIQSTLGKIIPVKADTICIHGDGPHAFPFAKKIRQTLEKFQIEIKSIA